MGCQRLNLKESLQNSLTYIHMDTHNTIMPALCKHIWSIYNLKLPRITTGEKSLDITLAWICLLSKYQKSMNSAFQQDLVSRQLYKMQLEHGIRRSLKHSILTMKSKHFSVRMFYSDNMNMYTPWLTHTSLSYTKCPGYLSCQSLCSFFNTCSIYSMYMMLFYTFTFTPYNSQVVIHNSRLIAVKSDANELHPDNIQQRVFTSHYWLAFQ